MFVLRWTQVHEESVGFCSGENEATCHRRCHRGEVFLQLIFVTSINLFEMQLKLREGAKVLHDSMSPLVAVTSQCSLTTSRRQHNMTGTTLK